MDKLDAKRILARMEADGAFVTGDDGFVVYWPDPERLGAYSAWVLRLIADELDRRNGPWAAHLAEALTVAPESGDIPNDGS